VDTFAKLRWEREGVEGQGRRQFTDEFKREAVALLASSGRPVIQCERAWYLPLDAAQLAQSQRRAECGGDAAPDTVVGPAFRL
jgi:transposase-like protein